jgi:hypothetical protein
MMRYGRKMAGNNRRNELRYNGIDFLQASGWQRADQELQPVKASWAIELYTKL